MRIVSGKWRSKTLLSPSGLATRPTSDKVRGALFNILSHAAFAADTPLDGALIMDGFAGTGALGLEALSRGAAQGIFIEKDGMAARTCLENIKRMTGDDGSALFLKTDITALHQRPANITARDIVFLDPPYGLGLGEQAILRLHEKNWLHKKTLVVLEMARKQPENCPAGFEIVDRRDYSDTAVWFLRTASC